MRIDRRTPDCECLAANPSRERRADHLQPVQDVIREEGPLVLALDLQAEGQTRDRVHRRLEEADAERIRARERPGRERPRIPLECDVHDVGLLKGHSGDRSADGDGEGRREVDRATSADVGAAGAGPVRDVGLGLPGDREDVTDEDGAGTLGLEVDLRDASRETGIRGPGARGRTGRVRHDVLVDEPGGAEFAADLTVEDARGIAAERSVLECAQTEGVGLGVGVHHDVAGVRRSELVVERSTGVEILGEVGRERRGAGAATPTVDRVVGREDQSVDLVRQSLDGLGRFHRDDAGDGILEFHVVDLERCLPPVVEGDDRGGGNDASDGGRVEQDAVRHDGRGGDGGRNRDGNRSALLASLSLVRPVDVPRHDGHLTEGQETLREQGRHSQGQSIRLNHGVDL